MKKFLLLARSLVVAAAFAARVSAQSESQWLSESSRYAADDEGPLSEPRHISFGMTPDGVVQAMKGKPDGKLAADIWVYWDFQTGAYAGGPKFDTLVVFFSRERVFKYRLVEKKPVLALLAEVRKAAKLPPVVAKK